MTTTVKTVTRQTLTRSWTDLDPKIAVQALIVVLADAALVVLYVLGKIDGTVLAAGLGPSGVVTLLGYLKGSSHKGLVVKGEQVLADAEAIAPAVEAAIPAAGPVVEEAEGILSAIGLAPATFDSAPPAAPATTGTLTLGAAQ